MTTKLKPYFSTLVLSLALLTCSSCLIVDTAIGTTKAVGFVGKTAFNATKATGKGIYHTARATGKGVKYLAGSRSIPLERQGDSYYLNIVLNKKHHARMLLDTGASAIQVPFNLAIEMGVPKMKTRPVRVQIANGSIIEGRSFILNSVQVSGAKAKNVTAIVIRDQKSVGLLGMSFLNQFHFKIDTDKHVLYLKAK